jgi:AcrR family transcriptional regulator
VARPKVALISRQNALEAALRIVDTEGLDALSIRRLATELGVNGASLYHHFANKEEIVAGAAQLALADALTHDGNNEKWQSWLPRNGRALREVMLDHPELVPVIIRNGESGMQATTRESAAQRLVDEGVPLSAVGPLLDAMEMFVIGSAVHGSRQNGARPAVRRGSVLAKAGKASALSGDEVFDVVSAAIVRAVAAAAKPNDGAKPAARTAATRNRAGR